VARLRPVAGAPNRLVSVDGCLSDARRRCPLLHRRRRVAFCRARSTLAVNVHGTLIRA
jgi:hypothetical protein